MIYQSCYWMVFSVFCVLNRCGLRWYLILLHGKPLRSEKKSAKIHSFIHYSFSRHPNSLDFLPVYSLVMSHRHDVCALFLWVANFIYCKYCVICILPSAKKIMFLVLWRNLLSNSVLSLYSRYTVFLHGKALEAYSYVTATWPQIIR